MIREVTIRDVETAMDAASACGLFSADELPVLRDQLHRTLSGKSESKAFWLAEFDENGSARGVAYCAEEKMTDRVWNLLFIGVRTSHQGLGLGAALLGAVEEKLRTESQRLLIVDTANGDDFEQARSFYEKHGFREEATVRDFYADGMNKITFVKGL